MMVRPIHPDDIQACGIIAHEAHSRVAAAHNFPSEHPSAQFSVGMIGAKAKDTNAAGFVAEQGGKILGSIFLNTFSPAPVAAIGPLTVAPQAEGSRVGRMLMLAAVEEAAARHIEQVRLVQSPSHLRSLALYSKLGFDVREPLLMMQAKYRQIRPMITSSARLNQPTFLLANSSAPRCMVLREARNCAAPSNSRPLRW
jgi:predicted N-acetyltransferase YhbS